MKGLREIFSCVKNGIFSILSFLWIAVCLLWLAYYLITGGLPPRVFFNGIREFFLGDLWKYYLLFLYPFLGGGLIFWYLSKKGWRDSSGYGSGIVVNIEDFIFPFAVFNVIFIILIKWLSPCSNFLCLS